MTADLKRFILLFLKNRGIPSENLGFQPLGGDGSQRLFFRISPLDAGSCFIAMENPPTDSSSQRENFAYLAIGRHLFKKGIPIPEIYHYDLKHGWFIMQDVGQTNLQEWVAAKGNPVGVYERVLGHLFQLQIEGEKGFDVAWCCHTKKYDRSVMGQYESGYFTNAFLHLYHGLKANWPELDTSFNHLAHMASLADSDFFLHRDFQSRNIMVSSGNIGIIDWQGGRLGPLGYDLASLLIDPYVALSVQQRNEIFEKYLLLLKEYNAGWVEPFKKYYPYLAIQRNLQILGAFSYLTKIRNKHYFEVYIPPALATLQSLVHQLQGPELSPLRDLVNELRQKKHPPFRDNALA